MAIVTHNAQNYYIAAEALQVTENAGGDPRRILVSLQSGSIIKVYDKTISYFNTASDGSFKSWPINAYNTQIDGLNWFDENGNIDPKTLYMYARINESQSMADIVFTRISPTSYKMSGIADDDGVITHFVHLGTMTYAGDEYSLTWDMGDLGTDRSIQEATASDEMFELVNDQATSGVKLINPKFSFLSVSIKNALTLAGRAITAFLSSSDNTAESAASDAKAATSSWIWSLINSRLLRKDKDESTSHKLTMGSAVVNGDTQLKGTTTFGNSELLLGTSGNGFATVDGNGVLQIDRLQVLQKIEAKEAEIQQVNYIGGTQVLTPSNGFTVTRVEWVNSSGNIVTNVNLRRGYRLYFDNESDGRMVKNTWQADDFAYCQSYNVKSGTLSEFSNHFWWRRLIGAPNPTDNFINVWDFEGNGFMHSLSEPPQVGDKVVMLGNRSNSDRQSAIILSASESGSPYFRMYKGIDTFSLADAECIMNLSNEQVAIYAKSIIMESNVSVEQELTTLKSSYEQSAAKLNDVSNQLDKSFEIHQSETSDTPDVNNEPASTWRNEGKLSEHVGDFYINADGLCWKFHKYEEGGVTVGYGWEPVNDVYLDKFVKSIDAKSRIYRTNTNELPQNYKMNDLWVNANYNLDGVNYQNEMLVCYQEPGSAPSIEDWQPSNDYQANVSSYLEQMKKIAAEYDINLDGKIENYFVDTKSQLDAKAQEWAAADGDSSENTRMTHLGDLGYTRTDKKLYEYTRKRNSETDPYVYGWELSTDEITKAVIEMAAVAKDTADGKRTTFIFESGKWPSGYQVGDFWVGVTGMYNRPSAAGITTDSFLNDALVCISTAYGDIRDWSLVGVSKSWVLSQGFVDKAGYYGLFAKAMTGTYTDAEATLGALVQYDEALGRYISAIQMKANNIIVDGQTTFKASLENLLSLSELRNLVNGKISSSDLMSALERETIIAGGYINTDLIEADKLIVKHLDGADGTFDGFIQTKFVNADEVETFVGDACTLSGSYCNLIAPWGKTIKLPTDASHIGKRITLQNTNLVNPSQITTVVDEDGGVLIGYQGRDTEYANNNSVTKIQFYGGILEFLAVKDGASKCRWICVTNKTKYSKGNADMFADGSGTKMLYYAIVENTGATVGTMRQRSIIGTPVYTRTGKGIVKVDISSCLPSQVQLYNCVLSVTGFGCDTTSALRPTTASIGEYNEPGKWFEVRTSNYNGYTDGNFILRIDY